MMKRIATTTLALGFSLAAAAAAANTPIFKAPIGAQEATKSKAFGINPELGRAWVEVNVYHDPTETTEVYRVPVPGLSYDKTSGQVVYDAEGRTVVCAKVRETGRFLFKSQRVDPTGDCELTRRYVKQPIDDGFAVDVVEHFEVYFQPAGHAAHAPKAADRQS